MMMPVILAALGPIVSSQQSDKLHLSVDPQERLLSRKYEWRPDYTSCPAIWKDGQPAKNACYNTNSQKKVPKNKCPRAKKAYLCPQPEYQCQDIRGKFLADDEWEKVSLGARKAFWLDERKEKCKTKAIKKGMNWMLVKKWLPYRKWQCYHSDAIPQTSEEGKDGYAGCGMVKQTTTTTTTTTKRRCESWEDWSPSNKECDASGLQCESWADYERSNKECDKSELPRVCDSPDDYEESFDTDDECDMHYSLCKDFQCGEEHGWGYCDYGVCICYDKENRNSSDNCNKFKDPKR